MIKKRSTLFLAFFAAIFLISSCEGVWNDEENPFIIASCDDGIKNQNEQGVDCGGPCLACDIVREDFYRLRSYNVIDVIPNERKVRVLFQVLDFNMDGVPNLSKDDFIITENNNTTSESISTISPEAIPFKFRTVLLLDVSSSIKENVDDIKQAAIALINDFSLNQEMAIYTFDSDTKLLVDFTSDKSALIAAINTLNDNNLDNSTNLYNAIIDVSDEWQESYSIDSIVDGSLIIFTDGRHTAGGSTTVADVKTALGDNRSSTYFAAVQSSDLDPNVLKEILGNNAEDRYFEAQDFDELEAQFLTIRTRIENLANSIYFLNYTSPISEPDDVVNDLKIEVKGNTNNGDDHSIVEQFNSKGFN